MVWVLVAVAVGVVVAMWVRYLRRRSWASEGTIESVEVVLAHRLGVPTGQTPVLPDGGLGDYPSLRNLTAGLLPIPTRYYFLDVRFWYGEEMTWQVSQKDYRNFTGSDAPSHVTITYLPDKPDDFMVGSGRELAKGYLGPAVISIVLFILVVLLVLVVTKT